MSETYLFASGIIDVTNATVTCKKQDFQQFACCNDGFNEFDDLITFNISSYSYMLIEKMKYKSGDKVDFKIGMYSIKPNEYICLICPYCCN